MTRRILAGTAVAGICLLFAASALAGDARPLQQGVLADAPATAALFHPDNAASLTVLDRMRDAGNDHVLAVCVGQGCDAPLTEQIAAEHGWSFPLAYDASGDRAQELLGSATVPGVVRVGGALVPARTAQAAQPVSAPAAAPRQQPSGLVAGLGGPTGNSRNPLSAVLTTSPDRKGPSVVQIAALTVPVALLGLGLGVLYLGSRRREDRTVEERDEDSLLAEHVHSRHGRKSARPSSAS